MSNNNEGLIYDKQILDLRGFQLDAIKEKLFENTDNSEDITLIIDENTFNEYPISGKAIGWKGSIKAKVHGFIKIGEDVEVITREYYEYLKKRVERLERKIK